ncbi:MAG: HD domain-containing protein [Proteobacteria bacterium]|nr:HD domain-containing protein [Pseudomonadota bacterium]
MRQEDSQTTNQDDQSIDLDGSISIAEVSAEDIDEAALGVRGIPLDKIERGKKLIVDLYLPRYSRKDGKIVVHRILKAGKPLRAGEFNFLRNYGFDVVYVPIGQMPQFLDEEARKTRKALNNPLATTDAKAEMLRDNATMVVEQAMTDPRLGDNIQIGRELVTAVTDFIDDTPDAIQSLVDILTIDYSLLSHSVNVCLIIVALGYFLGLTKDQITSIGLGGLFHDVGKRNLPEAILKKPSRLEEDEWALMRNHPTEGFQMLRESGRLPAESLKMVYQHHENIDGTGYPRGLTGEQIATQSQLIRIIDAYDAITSERVYKSASTPSEAIRIISHEMYGQFNELLLQSFVKFLGRIGGKKPMKLRPRRHP